MVEKNSEWEANAKTFPYQSKERLKRDQIMRIYYLQKVKLKNYKLAKD